MSRVVRANDGRVYSMYRIYNADSRQDSHDKDNNVEGCFVLRNTPWNVENRATTFLRYVA